MTRKVNPPEQRTSTWVVVGPRGVCYVGLHEDEAGAWAIALGWPDAAEIAERKAQGWYAAQATITWQRPSVRLTGVSDALDYLHGLTPEQASALRKDAESYRWIVDHASSFDGAGDSDNMVRLWFYRPDKREVMVQCPDLDAAIAEADTERRMVLASLNRSNDER